ncbi:hypothetical protein PC116_g15934 [Phytophthora cactorum]|uniref:Uncharacterized protein n=1 Tax=Phytophthora cactorum TaxID=29920 RepID=A0A8T1D5V3_9STRA|nr:hypothetical protein PC117_g12728 [Phytophthora cactorum]KAG3159738.1 hypothetical protein C6341_g14011 [Phytophthora cactorum]KAG4235960.1 hypothetical protein PC116_g15934 [Phytophthora cactorum]
MCDGNLDCGGCDCGDCGCSDCFRGCLDCCSAWNSCNYSTDNQPARTPPSKPTTAEIKVLPVVLSPPSFGGPLHVLT